VIRDTNVLEHCHSVLEAGGYDIETREIDGIEPVLLAETLYALVMVVAVPGDDVERFIEDAQATLTRVAAVHPSPRSWDLYLVLVADEIRSYDEVRERYEADTRYARKLIVTGGRDRTEQLLRSLLPLRPAAEIALPDPLAEVREQLLATGTNSELVEAAITSFETTSEVRIP
jgi:hypothetical protein